MTPPPTKTTFRHEKGSAPTQVVKFRGKYSQTPFRVPKSWTPLSQLGSGAYGTVVAFHDAGTSFAVKKVADVFTDCVLALRTLREIRLLAHFQYEHVLGIRNVYVEGPSFKDVYVCLDLMDADLASLIEQGREPLKESQCQSILFQVMCGLLCLHTACVIHRDLKPNNVLVSGRGVVKLADLGLARSIEASARQDTTALTEYVVTRFYRAPEVVLTATEYTYAVDVWSAGCILGEMLFQQPLFQGKDPLDQIRKIVASLGSAAQDDLGWLPHGSSSKKFIEALPRDCSELLWHRLGKFEAGHALKLLLMKMVCFNPKNRISVEGVLNDTYLADLLASKALDVAAARKVAPVDWSFDWDLCYDEKGMPKKIGEGHCREALSAAFAMVEKRNLQAENLPRLSLGSNKAPVLLERKPKGTALIETQPKDDTTKQNGDGHAKGSVTAAVGQKLIAL